MRRSPVVLAVPLLLIAPATGPSLASADAAAISFSDVSVPAGLEEPLLGMRAHAAAWGDVNGDGWEDLFVGTFADRPEGEYMVRGATGPSPDRLLLGGPAGFVPAAGFPEMFGRTSGAAFVDLDNDGDLDLVVSRNFRPKERGNTPTQVLRNDGGTFAIAGALVTDLGGRSIGVLDYDGDGLLDLFVAEDRWSGGSSALLRNLGGLQFADVTAAAGLPSDVHGLGVGTGDLNADSWPDLVVAGSVPGKDPGVARGARLFLNTASGGFREVDNSVFTWDTYGPEDDVAGVALGDVNRDGRPDIVLGQHYGSTLSQARSVPVHLYLHRGLSAGGDPIFEDVTAASGLAPVQTKAPHVEIADLDNDGWPDILATASSEQGASAGVFQNLGSQGGDPAFASPEGLGSAHYWPVGATADANRDGLLDVFLAEWSPGLPSVLLQNATAGAHWVSVSVAPAAVSIGSVVEVYRAGQMGDPAGLLGLREITATTGYGGGVPAVAHVGLGDVTLVDIRVRLPHGQGLIESAGVPTDQELQLTAEAPAPWPPVYLTSLVEGLENPVDIVHAGDGSGRLFVVEQFGRIRIVKDGAVGTESFLDLSSRVGCSGLFTAAFPPQYSTRGHFYAAFEDASCNLVVARYEVTADPDVADPGSEEVVLTIPMAEPGAGGHSGSKLAFGPDGYLYVSIGDGSHGGDPGNLAQGLGTLLGKILRIDVETGDPPTYTVPPTNPFVGTPGARPEIWARGLRNPWRMSFDRGTGDLFIGDVGEDEREEVNHQPAGSGGGQNYGWRIMEGTSCFNPNPCDSTGLTMPVAEYDHSQGCSVTGGVVYRGTRFPELGGIYLYGDYCTGQLWGLRPGSGGWQTALLTDTTANIVGFGESEDGEVFLADHLGGAVYQISTVQPGASDLAVTKTDSPDPVAVNGTLTYTISVTNAGPSAATGTDVTDSLPDGVPLISASSTQGACLEEPVTVTCNLGTIPPDGTVTVTLLAGTPTAGTITNTVQVTGNEPDPAPANNSAAESTVVGQQGSDGSITGIVTTTGGAPLATASVSAKGPVTVKAKTGADGKYALVGLAPGSYKVKASKRGCVRQQKSVTLVAGQSLTVDFQLAC